jgi:hypothetical protein
MKNCVHCDVEISEKNVGFEGTMGDRIWIECDSCMKIEDENVEKILAQSSEELK